MSDEYDMNLCTQCDQKFLMKTEWEICHTCLQRRDAFFKKQGFDEAIDKILEYLNHDINSYARDVNTPRMQTRKAKREQEDSRLQFRTLELFRQLVVQLFKMEVSVPDA